MSVSQQWEFSLCLFDVTFFLNLYFVLIWYWMIIFFYLKMSVPSKAFSSIYLFSATLQLYNRSKCPNIMKISISCLFLKKLPYPKRKYGRVIVMIIYDSMRLVCLGLTSILNIWGHSATVPACSSDTLTNVQPHRNAMSQTQDMTPTRYSIQT